MKNLTLDQIKILKSIVIKSQNFEMASVLRDLEKSVGKNYIDIETQLTNEFYGQLLAFYQRIADSGNPIYYIHTSEGKQYEFSVKEIKEEIKESKSIWQLVKEFFKNEQSTKVADKNV